MVLIVPMWNCNGNGVPATTTKLCFDITHVELKEENKMPDPKQRFRYYLCGIETNWERDGNMRGMMF